MPIRPSERVRYPREWKARALMRDWQVESSQRESTTIKAAIARHLEEGR